MLIIYGPCFKCRKYKVLIDGPKLEVVQVGKNERVRCTGECSECGGKISTMVSNKFKEMVGAVSVDKVEHGDSGGSVDAGSAVPEWSPRGRYESS